MQQLTNFGSTTLNGTITNTDVTLAVNDASTFPTSGNFTILLDDELINVTGVSSNTFTIVRGQEGTTAAAHTNGVPVKLVLSKEVLENFFSERFLVGGYASRPSSPRAGQRYFANDVDLGWEFNGTNWDLIHPLYIPYNKRVNLTGWTGVNLGATIWTDINGTLDISVPGGSGDNWRLYTKDLPTAPYTFNAIWRIPCLIPQYSTAAIGLYDGTKLLMLTHVGDGSNLSLNVHEYTNITTYTATRYNQIHWQPPYFWTRIRDDNTNLFFEFSTNGMHYNTLVQSTRTHFVVPTKLVIGVDRTENTFVDSGHVHYQLLGCWEG